MRTIVVDDEELSMRQFEIECAQVREIELVGEVYQSPGGAGVRQEQHGGFRAAGH